MNHCNNCKAAFKGDYCNHCGQKASVGRLHMHDVLHELWHGFIHADKGVLRLIRDLVTNPSEVYPRYFAGQRKLYFSPVLFYILTAGLSIYIGDKVFDYENHVNQNNNEFGKFVLDHTKLLDLFLLPAEALLTWAFFHRRFNLAENAVFWLYASGLVFLFHIVTSPIYFLFIEKKKLFDYLFSMAGFLIIFWQMCATFAAGRSWKNYLVCFFLIIPIIILYQYAGYYLLFDNDTFHQPVWKMIKAAFTPGS